MGKTRKNKQRKTIPPPGPCQCHPRVGSSRPSYGCLPPDVLHNIAQKAGVKTQGKQPEQIRRDLEHKFKVSEGAEYSFLAAAPISPTERSNYQEHYLRPKMPDEYLRV